jgi:trans-aconitate methyltransferase
MELREAISLIQTDEIIQDKQTTWADLGCGSGLFTRALSSLLYTGSTIYAVDKRISSFQRHSFSGQVLITTIESDFVRDDLNLQNLDGILMANSLHFVKNKKQFIEKLIPLFYSTPVFLMVEYDTDFPNPWVPHPLRFDTLKKLFTEMGFSVVKKINEKKSLYHSGKIYSAIIIR